MKKYSHAWLAFMAIKRLEETKLSSSYQKYVDNLITWFKNHRDCVIQGAWYPDAVIKDMANSHVLKMTPSDKAQNKYKRLPTSYLNYKYGKSSPLRKKSFTIEENDNLPDRCESIAQSVIDHLKMLTSENKGSPVAPTNNQIALLLFMLSHYVADAHMLLHCDVRRFSVGCNLHGYIEKKWEDMIKKYYDIDEENDRFFYSPSGYPLRGDEQQGYNSSFLKAVDDVLSGRKFSISWGVGNNNVWDFMSAVCQHSFLLSYCFIPQPYDHTNINLDNWSALGSAAIPGQTERPQI